MDELVIPRHRHVRARTTEEREVETMPETVAPTPGTEPAPGPIGLTPEPVPETPAAPAARVSLLVWIDAEQAVLVRWNGEARIERIASEVPPHVESTGHLRYDPTIRHGGGGLAQDRIQRDRFGHLRAYLDEVAGRIGPGEDVEILGPGTVREELARVLRDDDLRHGRRRTVVTAASRPLTERQLVARLRDRMGEPPPRQRPRRVG